MDILRKELDAIYRAQRLELERMPLGRIDEAKAVASALATATGGLAVVTDASCNRCYIYGGAMGKLLGLSSEELFVSVVDSSDEDAVYERIHPEDLPDKRMLEYEFFKRANSLDATCKKGIRATCRIRMADKQGHWLPVDNSTQVIGLSEAGKIWLILCCYSLSPSASASGGIEPCIVNSNTAEISRLDFNEERTRILTPREKEILQLVRAGLPSKCIADALGISVHTVNRHRQNVIEKLSVGNIIEAITAAQAMRLL